MGVLYFLLLVSEPRFWRCLSKDAMRALGPAGLNVGEVVPETMSARVSSSRLGLGDRLFLRHGLFLSKRKVGTPADA